MNRKYDVVAVNHETNRVRFVATGKTLRNAEAVESTAVMRRGCDVEFFAVVAAGALKEGDQWNPDLVYVVNKPDLSAIRAQIDALTDEQRRELLRHYRQ